MNFLWQDKKMWPFDTDDCLIEVTTWAGLTALVSEKYMDSFDNERIMNV
jgi:hypothetical protein